MLVLKQHCTLGAENTRFTDLKTLIAHRRNVPSLAKLHEASFTDMPTIELAQSEAKANAGVRVGLQEKETKFRRGLSFREFARSIYGSTSGIAFLIRGCPKDETFFLWCRKSVRLTLFDRLARVL